MNTTILANFAYRWFQSLDINKQITIAEQYTDETGDNTNIVNGFTDASEEWVIQNYTDDIKDFTIVELGDLCRMAFDELIAIQNNSEDSTPDTIQNVIESIGLIMLEEE